MMSKVLITRNHANEMISIMVDGKVVAFGNFWDISTEDWVNVLEEVGADVDLVEDEEDWEDSDDE